MMRCLTLAVVAALAGCGGKPSQKFVTVEGTVTVAGRPLTAGQVGFIPDESRGATHPEYSIGEIDAEGRYKLVTNSTGGVRPGWYKVVVWAPVQPLSTTPSYGADGKLAPIEWRTDSKYTTKETTDLSVEVVDRPADGAYNFDLDPPAP